MELSIIIVNYNGLKYLDECLKSLIKNLEGIVYEIIIIDNNSKDESCQFIKDKFPFVKLIESKINYGFGKGNNEAVKYANGDFLLLINNDTVVLDNLLPVLNHLKSDESIGVVGINMLNGKQTYIPAAGVFPNYNNMFLMKKLLQISQEFVIGSFSRSSYNVDWLGGSFLLLSKVLYQEVKGFDEDYFMYVEDVDFCKKIAKKGRARVFLPNYSYIHFVGFTKSKNPMLIKGYELYISKHFNGFEKLKMLAALKTNKLVKKIKSSLDLD
jgi:GT2 family glycosyltransferase